MVQLIRRHVLVGGVGTAVLVVLLSHIQLGEGNETPVSKSHGPNADPNPGNLATNSVGLRNRFPTQFQKNEGTSAAGSSGGVKILEALSSRILKSNPAPVNKSEGIESKATQQKAESRMGRDYEDGGEDPYDDTMESDELLVSPFGKPVFSKRAGIYAGSPSLPGPVYSNGMGGSSSYHNNNNYKPKPTHVSYKPGGGGGGMKPIVFPPVMPTTPTTTTPVGIVFPPEPVGPEPTSGPVGPPGPPSPTVVPIIGGGSGGVGGGGGGEEDIFPPAPPELEGVGRSLNLRTSSPRTRLLSGKTGSSREGKSSGGIPSGLRRTGAGAPGAPGGTGASRGAPGAPGNSGGRIRTTRLRDRVRESLEELAKSDVDGKDSSEEPENSIDSGVITDFAFEDIRCFKTRTKEYFGATIHMKRGFHQPYVRDRPQDPLTSNECRMELKPGTKATFHMTVTDLRNCGVEQCGDFMCLTMVFPRVPSLALADDEVTTIKCLPQKSTMADTRTISFAGDTLENRKSSSTVEGGGQDFAAEVGVFRQNPGASNGLFVKRVNSGGVVQLGEPLQLRSIVRGGDGWKHSRLSEVKVWRMRDSASASNVDALDPNDASEVITLVDGKGCRNDEYQVIAESHPLKDPRNDLVNHFTFKAFLFRGQRANEPLILTAKVHACQEDLDCIPDDCDGNSGRKKRSPVEIHNSSSIIHDWNSRMALRVVGLKDHSASLTEEDFPTGSYEGRGRSLGNDDFPSTCAEKMAASGLGGGLVVLLLCGISLALYAYTIKGRETRRTKGGGLNNNNNFSTVILGSQGHPPPGNRLSPPGQPQMPPQMQQMQQQQRILPPGFPEGPKINKPLPPTPSSNNAERSAVSSESSSPEPDHLSKTELSNVAKMLQKLAEKRQKPTASKKQSSAADDQTDYECIDETTTSKKSKKSGGDNGVYIVYCVNEEGKGNNKGILKRPKSAPASLREKRRSQKKEEKKNRKKISPDVYAHPSPGDSPSSEETPSEESDESSASCSSDPNNNNSGFANRRTVRSVKSRSSRHVENNHSRSASERKGNKVVSGIRRRLSSFYRDRDNGGMRREYKSRGSKGRRSDGSDGGTLMSSDLDSAYYGSEFNDDVLQEMRQLAVQHQNQQQQQMQKKGRENQMIPLGLPELINRRKQKELLVTSVKEQLRNCGEGRNDGHSLLGPNSPPLEPGQTKAAHFVTRNETSTQILIVPETHV